MTDTTMTYPSVFTGADQASTSAQSRYVVVNGARLVLAVGAAVLALFAGEVVEGKVEIYSLLAALAFLGALGMEVWLLADRPERTWYDGRALAESVKTLTWRFAVGGLPFPAGTTKADAAFTTEVAALLEHSGEMDLPIGAGPLVTDEMRSLRESPLAARRSAYLQGRLGDQQAWYTGKAASHRMRTSFWKLFLVAIEIAGVGAAFANAFGAFDVDLASVISSAIGAGCAWLAVRQHELLARAYGFAAFELGVVATRLQLVEDEERWAAEVASAEGAISREHTMWRAARVVLIPRAGEDGATTG